MCTLLPAEMPYLILERPGVRERGGDVEGEQGIRKGGRDKGSQGEGEGGGGGGGRGGGGGMGAVGD